MKQPKEQAHNWHVPYSAAGDFTWRHGLNKRGGMPRAGCRAQESAVPVMQLNGSVHCLRFFPSARLCEVSDE